MEPTIDEIRKCFALSRSSRYRNGYILQTTGENYPAWVIRTGDEEYGVAIPYEGDTITEDFNEINFYSGTFYINHEPLQLLVLTSENENSREQFAVFCYSLVDPGKNGVIRRDIQENPLGWWKNWKELVGNSAVDKKPYAVIGELLVLRQLLEAGEKNVSWGGPNASTKDIETENGEYEVKSTLSRYGKTVKISGQFQMTEGKKTEYLVFNRFEKKDSGFSINGLGRELIEKFNYSEQLLEKSLKKLGYKKGVSARNETYSLLDQLLFKVDDSFPKITPESFTAGQIPLGIEKIEYTVNLDVCQKSLLKWPVQSQEE